MSTALSKNTENFLTLKQASETLDVSIETLLSWNQHNILKPTITPEGEIGYTKSQIEQFLTIRELLKTNTLETKTPAVQTPIEPFFKSSEPLGVQLLHPEDHNHEKVSGVKPSSSIVILSFAAILVVLTAALFNQQAIQTSKMKISGQIGSGLAIQLKNDAAMKKDLHNEGQSIYEEKISAPALYTAKPQTASESQRILALSSKRSASDSPVADSYASVSFPGSTDENSAIDESGNIQGEAMKPDALAALFGGIDEMIKGEPLKQISTDQSNFLLLLFTGGLTLLFVFQKQLAFSTKKPQRAIDGPPNDAYSQADFTVQKALEVAQKTDGTVVLYVEGKEYKISKPELNSESDQFIETLMTLTQPGMKEIEYDTLKADADITTPLSRLVTRLGFVGIKRDLFFPRTSKTSVLFRKYLTQKDLEHMNITTSQIVEDLAKTQ